MTHDIMWASLKRELKRELTLGKKALRLSSKACDYATSMALKSENEALTHVLEITMPRIERET